MQRIMQRVQRARRQSQIKQAAKTQHVQNVQAEQWTHAMQQHEKAVRKDIKAARKARKEDWEMGPLAPRRDFAMEPGAYGAQSMQSRSRPAPPEHLRQVFQPKAHLFVGDRAVVYTKGRDYGKIGKILSINEDQQSASLDCLATTDLAMIPEQRNDEQMDRPYIAMPGDVPLADLGLVARIGNRDVIVQNTRLNKDKTRRVIAGTGITIPLPTKGAPEPEPYENDDDTFRLDVDEETFMPYLLTPPLPEGVIDELRNKYSRLRVRRDAEYIERKNAEDKAMKESVIFGEKSMRSPLQELHAQRKKEAEARPPRQLPEDVMQRMAEALVEAKRQKNLEKLWRRVDR